MIENISNNGSPIKKHEDKKVNKPKKIFILGLIIIFIGLALGLASSFFRSIGIYNYNKKASVLEPVYIKELNLDEFKNIDIDVDNSDIEFIEADTYGISICYYPTEQGYEMTYKLEDDKLKIKDNLNDLQNNSPDAYFMFFDFRPNITLAYPEKGYIKIYMPIKEQYNEINIIKTDEGNISLNNTNTILKCTTLNINSLGNMGGEVKLNNITSQDAEIFLEEGKSIIRNLDFNRFIYKNSYGDALFENIGNNTASKIDIEMEHGKSEISNMVAKNIIYNNLYGESKLENVNSNSLEIISGNGDINALSVTSTYLDLSYGSGDLKFRDVNSTSFKAYVENGNFKILDSTIHNLDSSFVNSDVDLSNVSISNNLGINSENSNIKTDGRFTGNVAIYSDYGDINLITHISEEEYNYKLRTTSSLTINDKLYESEYKEDNDDYEEIFVDKQEAKPNSIEIISETGNIDLKFRP